MMLAIPSIESHKIFTETQQQLFSKFEQLQIQDDFISEWELLPDEVWTRIFQFLPADQLSIVRMVSKRWNGMSKDRDVFGRKLHVNVAVIGPYRSGKSTLIGHMLKIRDEVSRPDMKIAQERHQISQYKSIYPLLADPLKDELEKQKTIDIHRRRMECRGHYVTFINTPGFNALIKNTISGISQADHALLVISPEFTKDEVTQQLRVCKVTMIQKIIVAVTKLDTLQKGEDEIAFAKAVEDMKPLITRNCYNVNDIVFVPCSGEEGWNLDRTPYSDERLGWYKGPNLYSAISQLPMPNRELNKPLRITIDNQIKVPGIGYVLTGTVIQGHVSVDQWVKIGPIGHITQIKSLHLALPKKPIQNGYPGDYVSLSLRGMTAEVLKGRRCGLIMGFLKKGEEKENIVQLKNQLRTLRSLPIEQRKEEIMERQKDGPMYPVVSFEANLCVIPVKNKMLIGSYMPVLHCHNVQVPVRIDQILKIISRKSGPLDNTKQIFGGDALVVRMSAVGRPLSIDTQQRCPRLSRFLIRDQHKVIGGGVVTKIDMDFSNEIWFRSLTDA